MLLADRKQSFRFLLHDRDSKFSGGFNEVFRSEGMKIVGTPIRAPNANAHAERSRGPPGRGPATRKKPGRVRRSSGRRRRIGFRARSTRSTRLRLTGRPSLRRTNAVTIREPSV